MAFLRVSDKVKLGQAKRVPIWKKIVTASFFFFLIKGLVWLAIAGYAALKLL